MIFLALGGLAAAADVTVTQVAASGSGGSASIDSRLGDVKASLAKKFTFSKYEFLSRKSAKLEEGASSTWKLSDGNSLSVSYAGASDSGGSQTLTLTMEIFGESEGRRKTLMKTTIRRSKGQPLLLGVGKMTSGATLILVIKAS